MTYQRNMGEGPLQDGLDQGVPDGVEDAQVRACDDHEPERDRGALADLTAVGPLDALELGPGRTQEIHRASEDVLAVDRGAAMVVRVTVAGAAGRLRGSGRLRSRAITIVAAHLGEMRVGDVGHRLPERISRFAVAGVARGFIVADAVLAEIS